jgi:hypothetical protein
MITDIRLWFDISELLALSGLFFIWLYEWVKG